MRHFPVVALIALLSVLPAIAAEPPVTIFSVSPNIGPAEGGTAVTITGSGFTTCPICSPPLPTQVWFGDTPAAGVTIQNETTLVAVTPPHTPAAVDVRVEQWDESSSATLREAFVYVVEGTASDNERVLVPILLPPVQGAFGADFRTSFSGANWGTTPVYIHGLEGYCAILCPAPGPETPYFIGPEGRFDASDVVANGTPGRFLFIPKSQLAQLSFNLRVYDVSRSPENFGTELPVVRESRFPKDRIVLRGVPADVRFRGTLRIYSADPLSLWVSFGGVTQLMRLTAGASIYEPAFAQMSLPALSGPSDVVISRELCDSDPAPCPPGNAGFWAIVSVTNNDTQMITTITPQP